MLEHEDNIDTILENGISINDFTLEVNRAIYDTIVYLYKNDETGGVAIGSDTSLLLEQLETGDREYDKEAALSVSKIANLEVDKKLLITYVNKLRNVTKVRNIVQATKTTLDYLKNTETVDADELIQIYDGAYQNVFDEILGGAESSSTNDMTKLTIKELINDSMSEPIVKFNLSGIDDYAKILNGYLTYIVADTGIGKTTVGTYLASACAKNGAKVLFINLETKPQDCIKKLISANVEKDGYRIKYQHLINPILMNEKDWDIIEDIAVEELLAEYNIYWIYEPDMTTSELKRRIASMVRKHDIDVVIGDYYQLLRKDGYEDTPDSVTVPRISKDLMNIASRKYITSDGKSKQIAHVWLAQSNKEVIYRENKHPTKDDIYFGGARDARLVLGIYRDEYYNDESTRPGVIELGILKQNNGLSGMYYPYKFNHQYQEIRELTDEEKEILEGLENEE